MDTLVSVLLFLNVINPANNYTITEINNFAIIYSQQINNIENDLTQLDAVLDADEPIAITVIDGLGG